MKKKNRTQPLQLSRETLRHLDGGNLAVAGDWTTITTIYSVVVSCPQ